MRTIIGLLCLVTGAFCTTPRTTEVPELETFGHDLDFLRKHVEVILLSDEHRAAQVAVVPAYQGRVMTSTARGTRGRSFGWIHHEFIASGKKVAHINVYGGEDRFWLGPEGGQFSIFFAPGSSFDLEHWNTPAPIDTEAFDVVSQGGASARFRKRMLLTNYSGSRFDLEVDREVRLLGPDEVWKLLDMAPVDGADMVAYETRNRLTNTGPDEWRRETGLLSVWILGMFKPSPETTVVIPYRPAAESSPGAVVNDAYFGKVPEERLVIGERAVFFSGDGRHRSKIGVSQRRARPVMGSFDGTSRVLNLVQFTLPEEPWDYVNSMWRIQDDPYAGDAVNSYNDGPPAPGAPPLGPFYELESSSPAAALKPGASLTHVHRTLHIEGREEALDAIARRQLGVSLHDIRSSLPR